MHSKRSVLEVDPSIVERNLRITEPEQDELKHLFPKPTEEIPSKLVKPTPGFCIKTHTAEEDKVFINVCQTDSIPAPKDISEGQLLEILQSETPSEYRIPMSLGEGHPVTDKSGNPALAYDVAINPTFYNKIEKSQIFKQFFQTVVIEGIQDKFSIIINVEDCRILKNRKAMGNLQLHRIQQREINKKMNIEKKLIEEIDVSSIPHTTRAPIYKLSLCTEENEETLFADVFFPEIVPEKDFKDIICDVVDDRIVLECTKYNYFLELFVPYLLNVNSAKVTINEKKMLTIKIPVLKIAA